MENAQKIVKWKTRVLKWTELQRSKEVIQNKVSTQFLNFNPNYM